MTRQNIPYMQRRAARARIASLFLHSILRRHSALVQHALALCCGLAVLLLSGERAAAGERNHAGEQAAAGEAAVPAARATASPAAVLADASSTGADAGAALSERLRSFVEEHAAASTPAGARLQIQVNPPDPKFTGCARAEPFILPGTPMWGRTRLGIRCTDGARWSTTVAVQVTAYGDALVLRRPVPAGQAFAADDYSVQETELTREPPGLLSDPAELEQHVAARYLTTGMALRAEHLRAKPVVLQGDLVKVVFVGTGFTVESEGTATATAADGQPVRVQVDSGRVISGTARPGHRVEIR